MEPFPYTPRPAWMVPTQYNDTPSIPDQQIPPDDDPIDYSKGPHREVLGDDDEDEPEPRNEGVDS